MRKFLLHPSIYLLVIQQILWAIWIFIAVPRFEQEQHFNINVHTNASFIYWERLVWGCLYLIDAFALYLESKYQTTYNIRVQTIWAVSILFRIATMLCIALNLQAWYFQGLPLIGFAITCILIALNYRYFFRITTKNEPEIFVIRLGKSIWDVLLFNKNNISEKEWMHVIRQNAELKDQLAALIGGLKADLIDPVEKANQQLEKADRLATRPYVAHVRHNFECYQLLSKIHNEQLKTEKIHIKDVIQLENIRQFEHLYLDAKPYQFFYSDKDFIQLVFNELLRYCFKYKPKDKVLSVSVRFTKLPAEKMYFFGILSNHLPNPQNDANKQDAPIRLVQQLITHLGGTFSISRNDEWYNIKFKIPFPENAPLDNYEEVPSDIDAEEKHFGADEIQRISYRQAHSSTT